MLWKINVTTSNMQISCFFKMSELYVTKDSFGEVTDMILLYSSIQNLKDQHFKYKISCFAIPFQFSVACICIF